MTDDNLPLLCYGVFLIRENPGQRVSEDRSSLGKAHAVFSYIPSSLLLVPFKYRPHRVLITGYARGKA